MTATFLVTLVFLLSDGSPVQKGRLFCDGVRYRVATDKDVPIREDGDEFELDARGAIVLTATDPITIGCTLRFKEQSWRGQFHLSKHGQVFTRHLKKGK